MSRMGKALFLISGFSFLVMCLVRTVLGGWHDSLFITLGLFLVCFGMALVKERNFFKEFFTMRTTKHGMNMGVLILFFIVGLIAVNFLAVRHNLKWDLTSEKLNSLSDQSVKAVKQIDEDLKVYFFFRGGTEGVEEVQGRFKEMVELFKDENSKVAVEFVDAIKRPGLAKQYGVEKSTASVFLDYKGKRNEVDPLTEEGMTMALLKVTRASNKKVLLTTGHGERSAQDTGPTGLSELERALKGAGYDVETVSLVDKTAVPEKTDAVMVLGPQTAFLELELKILRDYARAGGKVFIAADPGSRHNIALLTKVFGVEFKNDYVLDQMGQLVGASAAMALGRGYGPTDITRDFDGKMTMFHLASSVKKDASTQFTVDDIVQTGDTSFTTDEVADGRVEVKKERRGPHTVGVTVKGKLEEDGANKKLDGAAESKEFAAVIYGDSDFFSNQLLHQQLNRDLTMNSVAYLLKETSMISIRPKQPAGTTLTLTRSQFWIFLFGVILPLPVGLFGFGGFSWYRRRNA